MNIQQLAMDYSLMTDQDLAGELEFYLADRNLYGAQMAPLARTRLNTRIELIRAELSKRAAR